MQNNVADDVRQILMWHDLIGPCMLKELIEMIISRSCLYS
jgi:hypothetical protein